MNLKTSLISYFVAIAVFFGIDMVWLGWLSVDFYKEHIGHLLGPVNWLAAALFYLMFIAGIVLFAVRPGLINERPTVAAKWGAPFGFITYGTYDLTNMATLTGWPWTVVVVDMLWGTVLCSAVAFITCWLLLKLGFSIEEKAGSR